MQRRFLRTIATALVLLSVLLPAWGNMAMALGIAEGRVLVLCTGQGLKTIVIGQSGEPVEISDQETDCTLVHAIDTAPRIAPAAITVSFSNAQNEVRYNAHTPRVPVLPSQPRAPPHL